MINFIKKIVKKLCITFVIFFVIIFITTAIINVFHLYSKEEHNQMESVQVGKLTYSVIRSYYVDTIPARFLKNTNEYDEILEHKNDAWIIVDVKIYNNSESSLTFISPTIVADGEEYLIRSDISEAQVDTIAPLSIITPSYCNKVSFIFDVKKHNSYLLVCYSDFFSGQRANFKLEL